MAQPIQIILMKQLAGYLSVPLFLVGPNGDLLFYNEPAEAILGRRFDETGAMSAKEWFSRPGRWLLFRRGIPACFFRSISTTASFVVPTNPFSNGSSMMTARASPGQYARELPFKSQRKCLVNRLFQQPASPTVSEVWTSYPELRLARRSRGIATEFWRGQRSISAG